jgi:hypothetical protein
MTRFQYEGTEFHLDMALPSGVMPEDVIIQLCPIRPVGRTDEESLFSLSSVTVEEVGPGAFFCHYHDRDLREASSADTQGGGHIETAQKETHVYILEITQPQQYGLRHSKLSLAQEQLYELAAQIRASGPLEIARDWEIIPVESFSDVSLPGDPLSSSDVPSWSISFVSPAVRVHRSTQNKDGHKVTQSIVYVLKSAFFAL